MMTEELVKFVPLSDPTKHAVALLRREDGMFQVDVVNVDGLTMGDRTVTLQLATALTTIAQKIAVQGDHVAWGVER